MPTASAPYARQFPGEVWTSLRLPGSGTVEGPDLLYLTVETRGAVKGPTAGEESAEVSIPTVFASGRAVDHWSA